MSEKSYETGPISTNEFLAMKQRIAQLERVNQKLYEVATKSDYGELRPDFNNKVRRSIDFN